MLYHSFDIHGIVANKKQMYFVVDMEHYSDYEVLDTDEVMLLICWGIIRSWSKSLNSVRDFIYANLVFDNVGISYLSKRIAFGNIFSTVMSAFIRYQDNILFCASSSDGVLTLIFDINGKLIGCHSTYLRCEPCKELAKLMFELPMLRL